MANPTEYAFDVVIAGGGVGGCAAAQAACRLGLRAAVVEEFPWIGGQLTSQAVPPDEHGWIERFGATASYRAFRENVRDYYRRYYPLIDSARANPRLNPGNGWVSPLCHEPRVAHAVLEAMLAPYSAAGRLKIWRGWRPAAADTEGDRIRALTFARVDASECMTVAARWFLDATELGDVLPLARVEHVTGTEARRETGEPSAPLDPDPRNVQAFSWCFAMEHREGEDHTIARPARYAYWRDYTPRLTPPWPGPLLGWTTPNPRTMLPNHYRFEPHREEVKVFSGLWSYRRLLDRSLFTPGFFSSDVCLVNWPLIDYLDGELATASEADRARFLHEAREMSLAVFYWLQTEAPRPDGGTGWRGLRLRADITGTADGLAQAPYIRESRRIRALHTIPEQEVSAAHRPGEILAERYPDSVGVGYYRIDLHPSTGGANYIDVPALPFRIPLRALIPQRVENMLAAAKNIGTTHITNGCYRLHPVEWNIGEAAGALAAYCHNAGLTPAQAASDPARVAEFQSLLVDEGFELAWPEDLRLEEGDPHIHAH